MDLPAAHPFHIATVSAIEHAIAASGAQAGVDIEVATTDNIGAIGAGIVIGPGSPYRDALAAESRIRTARERGVPLVGT